VDKPRFIHISATSISPFLCLTADHAETTPGIEFFATIPAKYKNIIP